MEKYNHNSTFKWKPRKPLKRTALKLSSNSDVAQLKKEIQRLLREIVIIRDGGCIARNTASHTCNGYRNDGELILQADHLITRSNSATYGDSRLVVCVCKGLHGWKSVGSNMRKNQYDALIKTLLPKNRVELWEKCEQESWQAHRMGFYDWMLVIVALKSELKQLQ